MAREIHALMQNSNDQDFLTRHPVEHLVRMMFVLSEHRREVLRLSAQVWVGCKRLETGVQPIAIRARLLYSKCLDRVVRDCREIGNRKPAQAKFSHPSRDAVLRLESKRRAMSRR